MVLARWSPYQLRKDSHAFTTLKSHLIEFLFRHTSLEFFGIQFYSALNSCRHKSPRQKKELANTLFIKLAFLHSPCQLLYHFNEYFFWRRGYQQIYILLSRTDLVCLKNLAVGGCSGRRYHADRQHIRNEHYKRCYLCALMYLMHWRVDKPALNVWLLQM